MPNNHHSLPYPMIPIPSLFSTTPPKLFDYETSSMSPTSTLETKHFSHTDHKKQGLLDVLHTDTKMVLFRSNSIATSPHSCPIESGIKTDEDPSFFSPLLLSEMELSEDYTCVISHGPNPKTIHIFDNFIVESCGDGEGFVAVRKESDHDFLSLCCACKKKSLTRKGHFYVQR